MDSTDRSAATTDLQLGEAVWIARDRSGMTQAKLASRLHVSRSQVANIEGGRFAPSIQTLEEIARALNVTFSTDGWTWRVGDA